jgi:type II secretory pathway component PulF
MPTSLQIQFFSQLAALLKAGMSVSQSLQIISSKFPKTWRQYLQQVNLVISQGENLATGLTNAGKYFDQWSLSLISLGEISGNLAETCEYLSQSLLQQQKLNKIYRQIILCAIACFTNLILLILVIASKLNFLTPSIVILGLIVVFICLNYQKLVLKIPLVGKILEARSMLNFTQIVIPLSCGLSIFQSMDLVENLCRAKHPNIANYLKSAIRQMKKGKTFSESLHGKFPAIALTMIKTGEETGDIAGAIARLAKYYEQELISSLKILQGILLPMSILAMGVFVALIGVEGISQYLRALPQ